MTDDTSIADIAEVLRSAAFRVGISHLFDDMALMQPHMRCVYIAKIFSEIKDDAVISALESMRVIPLLKQEAMLRLKNEDKKMKVTP